MQGMHASDVDVACCPGCVRLGAWCILPLGCRPTEGRLAPCLPAMPQRTAHRGSIPRGSFPRPLQHACAARLCLVSTRALRADTVFTCNLQRFPGSRGCTVPATDRHACVSRGVGTVHVSWE